MARLRIAIVAPTLDILGGHSVQAHQLLGAWRDDPDVCAWLVPINPRPPALLRPLVRIKYVRTVITEAFYIRTLLREIARADVVHIFSASYSSFLIAPLPAMLIARRLQRPIVLNYHSGEAPDHLERSATARAALARVERNVVPSPFLADVFGQFGLAATVIPNIVDMKRFRFRERRPLRARFLSTRNLGYPYNVACTLRAFRIIQDHRPDATLTIVGSGPDERALRKLAVDLRLERVSFRGRVAPDVIAGVYDDHDIYLQAPDIDNMPLSVLEAFACGLPVVSTAAGGMRAILEHGRHGLLVPVGDAAGLAAAALDLLNDPDRARRYAIEAHHRCQSYTWSVVRSQWLGVYRAAAAGGRPISGAATELTHGSAAAFEHGERRAATGRIPG